MYFNTLSDSTLQLIFKKLLVVESWYGIKEQFPQFKEAIKIISLLVNKCQAGFSLYILTKTMY